MFLRARTYFHYDRRSFTVETRLDTRPMKRPLHMGRGSDANASEEPTHIPTFVQTHSVTESLSQ